MKISIKHDLDKVAKKLSKIQQEVIPKAARSALNKTATQLTTNAARSISQKTGMKVGQVKKHLLKIRAQANRLQAEVIAKRYAPNLIEYMTAAQIKQAMQRKGQGIKAKAWRKTKVYRGSFVGRGKNSGKLLVLARRSSASNAKLKALSGPSVPRTFIEKEINRALRDVVRTRWPKNFDADLKFYLSKIG